MKNIAFHVENSVCMNNFEVFFWTLLIHCNPLPAARFSFSDVWCFYFKLHPTWGVWGVGVQTELLPGAFTLPAAL